MRDTVRAMAGGVELAESSPAIGRTSAKGRPYTNPYIAGVGLGLVLLAAFVVVGRGLGASGAFATTVAGVAGAVMPVQAASNPYFGRYLSAPAGPWMNWVLFEIIGVLIGGYLSARLAGRWRRVVERGPRLTTRGRLGAGFVGGTAMGLGAALARGCTSGQALSGGALLSVGGWLFMIGAFAGGYMGAPVFRRLWK